MTLLHDEGYPVLLLEGHLPAEFSPNPNKTPELDNQFYRVTRKQRWSFIGRCRPGVRFAKALLANYGHKLPTWFNDSVFPETIVQTNIRKQCRKLTWLELQLSTCG